MTPPGELPWTMTYGKAGNAATAGDGMLLKVSRAALKPGTTATPEGTATTGLVYDVPLSGTKVPYALGASDTAAWGQGAAPTDATAVFPADAVPASHAGSGLGAGDYKRATVTYTDASGRQVNTAQPGGHLSATDYDQYGNTVRELTARNREIAVGRTAAAKETLGRPRTRRTVLGGARRTARHPHRLRRQGRQGNGGVRPSPPRRPDHVRHRRFDHASGR